MRDSFVAIVKNADYSNLGNPKVDYVSDELAQNLKKYAVFRQDLAYQLQKFFDNYCGGMGSATYNKITHLVLPFYATSLIESVKNLVGTTTFANLPDSQLPTNYTLTNGILSQNNASFGSYSPQLSTNTEIYKISQFGIFPEIVGDENFFSSLGDGSVSIPANTRTLFAQKFDGTSNQFGAYQFEAKSKHVYSFTGLQGISSPTQNTLSVDGVESNFPIQAGFNITKISPIGSIGNPWSNYSSNRLRGAYLMGFAVGLTKEESLRINLGLIELAKYL